MNSVETITGANDGKMKPIKTFPEKYEISVRKMVGDNLSKDPFTPGGDEVWIVKDLDLLILDIMEFYEDSGNRRHSR